MCPTGSLSGGHVTSSVTKDAADLKAVLVVEYEKSGLRRAPHQRKVRIRGEVCTGNLLCGVLGRMSVLQERSELVATVATADFVSKGSSFRSALRSRIIPRRGVTVDSAFRQLSCSARSGICVCGSPAG